MTQGFSRILFDQDQSQTQYKMAETKDVPTSQNSKIGVHNGHRVRPASQIKNRQKVAQHTAEAQFNGLNRNQIIQQQIPGVGIVSQILKPRKLSSSQQGDELITLELFEKIKENSLLCQICTGIYFEPKSAGSCLHKFCKCCIDQYIKRIKKNCPMCRQFIMSHRNLRDDHKTKKIVEIMISDTQKYNENLQHLRQVEIEQVHNFAKFREKMESRYQRQIQLTIEQQELEQRAQQQAKQKKADEERANTEDPRASEAESTNAGQRKSSSVNRAVLKQDAPPVQVNRRGRPPKTLNQTTLHVGQLADQRQQQQQQQMQMMFKEEQQSSPEHSNDQQMVDSNGMTRKSSKKREKIIVPIQPRNANGTFAPCNNMLEEAEQQAMNAQPPLNQKTVEKRMAKDRQRVDLNHHSRDLERVSIIAL